MSKILRCYKKASIDIINSESSAFSNVLLVAYLTKSVEENWQWLKSTLINLIDVQIPMAKIRCFDLILWFNDLLQSLLPICVKNNMTLFFIGNDICSFLTNNPRHCVPHHRVIRKLTQLKMHPNFISWAKEFLSHRVQYTVFNSKVQVIRFQATFTYRTLMHAAILSWIL